MGWCIAAQTNLETLSSFKECPWRKVNDEGGEAVLIYDCRHPRAEELVYHVVQWKGNEELLTDMTICPDGHTFEAQGR